MSSVAVVWQDCKCDSVWGLRRRFLSLQLHKRILNSPCLLIILIHTKHKTIRWNLGLTPRLHSLEGEFIHLVDKAKNVWLTVRKLPIKAGCWETPLTLRDFSWSNKHGNHITDSLTESQIDSISYLLNFSALVLIFFVTQLNIFGTKLKHFGTKLIYFGSKLKLFSTKLKFFDTKLIFCGTKLKFFYTK